MTLLVVGCGWGALGQPGSAAACSQLGIAVDFDGTVVAVEGRRVTYRVDRVRQDDPEGPDLLPDPGDTVVVRYGEPSRLLRSGIGYRVRGWNARPDEVSSQIAHDFDGDCGTGAGTTALDGSYLGSSSKGFDRWWPYAPAGVTVIGGAALGLGVLVARRRSRP